ncbi:restriction endonuclease subunit S [Candidatus Poribacteria bacterium]|nr:MAG: restriction endonuclease subunit S [Candidatus Poribacteria bacterium]
MKRYPEYKESGVKWIGGIPKNWGIKRLKYVADLNMGQSPPSEEYNSDQIGTPFLQGNAEFGLHHPIPKIYCSTAKKYAILGDILLSIRAPVGAINIANQEYGIGRGLCAIRPQTNQLECRYAKYLLEVVRTGLHVVATGSTYNAVTVDDVSNLACVVPPFSEQIQIANFLDRKTEQIHQLIRYKEQKIELLHEQRIALINHAVTKGLNPNIEMKPSGVEWIGEIPKHWDIIKLRYLGELQNGISKDSDSFGLGYPFLSYGDVYYNETLPAHVEGLVNSTKDDRERYSVLERDIFFTRTSETIAEIGISSTCIKTIEDCVFSGFLIRFRNTSKVLTKEFSKYYFPSHLPRIFLAREMNIVTRSSLSQELLKRLPVLLPPIDYQKEIASFLDEQTQKMDSMIEKENKQIQLLKEYRQSLISEAVTGKIDVRYKV